MTRAPDSMTLPFDKELVVDLFAGGGGASMGIARAYKHPDVAVNHNRSESHASPTARRSIRRLLVTAAEPH